MKCPNCRDADLEPVLVERGVVVERCTECEGVWLDRGELALVADEPRRIEERLEEALKRRKPVDKPSPMTGKAMEEFTYEGGARIDYCTESGGLWFDAKELRALLERERGLHLRYDRGASRPASAALAPGAALLALPNLLLRSTATLAGLYAMLGAVLIAAVEFLGIPIDFAIGFGVVAVLLQFLLGPFFMDLSLRWLYRIRWISPGEMPDHLREFVERVCADEGIEMPRFGFIDDGAPQAFTYGHTPNNARIVLSRGIGELLEPDEVEAVVAHEIGHAVHWDMFLMTVAQLVPLLLYYLYRMLVRAASSSRGSKKGGGGAIVLAIGAYVLYIVAEYVVLWFSRTREYHADRFSGEVTGNPSGLASALVKIAYGLAGAEEAAEEGKEAKGGKGSLRAAGAMGIFDGAAAQALAVASYSAAAPGAEVDQDTIKGAMRWDLWNPWAKWFELHSTHPLVAKRLMHLSDQARHMGQEPFIVFDETQPESYWDEFFVDMAVHLLPMAAFAMAALGIVVAYATETMARHGVLLGFLVVLLGGTMLVRFGFAYKADFFPSMSVAALLKKVKVSGVRPVPCTLRGTVIGKGVPGYIASEDFVMRDGTGIMFLDFRQPLGLWEFFFGLLKAGEYQGQEVTAQGWYRRAPMPYVELKSIECDGKVRKSWVPVLYQSSALFLVALGGLWTLLAYFAPELLPY
jgi:Zn-dependent protease with chaperone function